MIQINNNIWTIDSELTLKTVASIYKKFKKRLKEISNTWTIDFSNCNKVDSSGLALIIEYIKHAKRSSIKLELKNIDSKILSLAKVHGAKDILEQFINKE
ncbi:MULTISPECIES: STAS domain-containing protein [unclassified Francisella]|uniref:STAS domain-containing protein n=1 Tax=unclassified Francisella TaxID=2610885 RepID=UPI002E3431CA|nr:MULTISPECIES: STAS domain-containing protein [unclassified Francisella]MED7818767.1 STAS domain-containing protein [Francisella sp. 19S2-4]MED7829516.1 STAS domain-containing protein [Francisella sp. 19S2-10]